MSGLPFEFPKTESKFVARTRKAADALRRKFGAAVPATDIVQEVMLEAIAEQARTGAKAQGFWRRLVNKVFDNYRREKVHRRLIDRKAAEQNAKERTTAGGSSAEHEIIARELRGEIERAVAELTTSDQEIWRRLGLSQSYPEIAEALGRSAAAVKQAAYRIRAHVRNRLPTEYQGG